jgi:hypothetical protein
MRRAWLTAAALMALPFVVYWATVSADYGFRDDYAHLREVHERPGWLTELTTANGRPVYGAALEASLRGAHDVADLSTLRGISVALLALVGLLLWAHLRRSGWSDLEAATIAAAITVLPGAQIIVGWAIAWPIALGLAAAVAGFALVDRGFAARGWRCAAWLVGGGLFYFIAGLTYQTSALFVVVPLAAVLLRRPRGSGIGDVGWVVGHIGVLFASMIAGLGIMELAVFSGGVVREAARMQIEPHPLIKLLWFARNPLPNSFALFAIRDRFATPLWFWLVLGGVIAVALLGLLYGARERHEKLRWLFVALALPFVAHSVSLAASSQAIGYRTLLPLSGIALVLFVFGVGSLLAHFGARSLVSAAAFGAFAGVGALAAHSHAFELIAVPQGNEWRLMVAAVNRLPVEEDMRVFIVRPTIIDRSTERIYADEYGSLSADSEWAAEEMLKAALRRRFPDGIPAGVTVTLDTGIVPPAVPYDFVVDLRELRDLGARAEAQTTASRR